MVVAATVLLGSLSLSSSSYSAEDLATTATAVADVTDK
jgi:hypothetical protein